MLAQTTNGISCFLTPRWRPDGSRNPIRIQRLKDKLGDRSNASSEIELLGAWAQLIGEEGRGIRTIIEMVNHTRLDCVLGSAALMRQGVSQAIWHAMHRRAFGRVLAEQPLMTNVLADLAIESEAATASALRLARAYDAPATDLSESLLRRLLTPIVKYWTCKRAPQHAAEVLECLGGNGYVEESGIPRLFRQSPVNGVWEGSGNVICLDVLRAMTREPDAIAAYWSEVALAGTGNSLLARAIDDLHGDLSEPHTLEWRARSVVGRMARVFQASLLVRFAPDAVADAFCAARLGDPADVFGTLPAGTDAVAIVARHAPA